MERFWIVAGALVSGLGVAAGAFATHGLRGRISEPAIATFETGARYQVYHGLALLAVGYAVGRWGGRVFNAAGWLFIVGVIIFSGCLYLLAITGFTLLGAIVPIGGAALLAGWAAVATGAWRAAR